MFFPLLGYCTPYETANVIGFCKGATCSMVKNVWKALNSKPAPEAQTPKSYTFKFQ